MDNLGRLQQFDYPALAEAQLLGQLQSFLQNTTEHLTLTYQCFQVLRQQQQWQIQSIQPQQPTTPGLSILWQISSAQLTINLHSSTIETDLGDPQLTHLLDNLFVQHTEQKPAYYFVDHLQFMPSNHYSSLFYLNQKYVLEQQFNQAIL